MRNTLSAALALGATISAPAYAGAPVWSVNKAASHLGFGVAVNNQGVKGEFRRWDAQIAFDPKALNQSRVSATIEMGSAVTGEATRDQSLPTADWFNTAAFPRATFTATSFKDLGGGRYQAIGDLTIRGVRRPVVLPFTLKITGKSAQMQGSLTINRGLFGVGQGQWKGAEMVAANVQINVTINATHP
ncbi:YceI family protein [Novosphingobium rosa]|uniref:YceI family protein n=1 Tax=Novosphingobium rosa TaxID=76978 RepID=UPI00082A0338|nr:YceI family protein [Novosphingobium rosa]